MGVCFITSERSPSSMYIYIIDKLWPVTDSMCTCILHVCEQKLVPVLDIILLFTWFLYWDQSHSLW